LSRADKTQTQITYDILLDEKNETIELLQVTVLCATRADDGRAEPLETALTTQPHVAFTTRYTFSRQGEVERFEVPAEAAKLLR
jgi:hypothetical protein